MTVTGIQNPITTPELPEQPTNKVVILKGPAGSGKRRHIKEQLQTVDDSKLIRIDAGNRYQFNIDCEKAAVKLDISFLLSLEEKIERVAQTLEAEKYVLIIENLDEDKMVEVVERILPNKTTDIYITTRTLELNQANKISLSPPATTDLNVRGLSERAYQTALELPFFYPKSLPIRLFNRGDLEELAQRKIIVIEDTLMFYCPRLIAETLSSHSSDEQKLGAANRVFEKLKQAFLYSESYSDCFDFTPHYDHFLDTEGIYLVPSARVTLMQWIRGDVTPPFDLSDETPPPLPPSGQFYLSPKSDKERPKPTLLSTPTTPNPKGISDASELFNQGMNLLHSGCLITAKVALETLINTFSQAHDELAAAHLLMAIVSIELGDGSQAQAHLVQSKELAPPELEEDQAHYHLQEATIAHLQKDFTLAATLAQTALEKFGNSQEGSCRCHLLLAQTYGELKQHPLAKTHFEKLKSQLADSNTLLYSEYLTQRALYLLDNQQVQEAESACKEAYRILKTYFKPWTQYPHPRTIDCLRTLTKIFIKQEKWNEASKTIRLAMDQGLAVYENAQHPHVLQLHVLQDAIKLNVSSH